MSRTGSKKKVSFGKILLWIAVIFVVLQIYTDGEFAEELFDLFEREDTYYTTQPPQSNVVRRAYLGVSTQDAPEGGGAAVNEVAAGSPAEEAGIQVGDIVVVIYDESGNYSVAMAQKANPEPDPMDPNNPGFPGFPGDTGGFGGMGGFDISGLMGSFGGMGSMGGYTGATEETEPELFDLEGDVLMTVTEQDVMTLTVQVDEQDIGKIALDMEALVKITPLKGRSFEARVTDLGTVGTNSGGSSNFTLELTLDLEADMLPGMSATAWLPLEVKKDVLTVPVAALVEETGRTVVYTALDPETGLPSNPVEVTTGVSDGATVEILSGLDRDAVIYYSYYEAPEISTEVESNAYSF